MRADLPRPAPTPDDASRRALVEDGVVVLPGLLDADWCARVRRAIERCRRAPGPHYGVLSPARAATVDSDLFRWQDDDDLRAVAHASPVVDAAAALLGSAEVVLVEDQWFASAPGASTPSPWHHDEPYYRLDRPFLTIWITLDDIDDRLSLRVVPRSHRDGALYAPVEFSAGQATIGGGGTLREVPDVDGGGFEVRSWSLAAGDAIALDSRLLHATGRGTTTGWFRRLSTRWADPDTRYRSRSTPTATFWDTIDHGLGDGDRIAGPCFPVVSSTR